MFKDLVFAVSFFLSRSRHQRRMLKKCIYPLIKPLQSDNDGSLGKSDFRKIEFYYGFLIPAFLGGMIEVLEKRKATPQEAEAMTFQAAMTGLFDDFTDEKQMDQPTLERIIDHPEQHRAADQNEQLFLQFYTEVLNRTSHDLIKGTLHRIHAAQIRSEEQVKANCSPDFLKEVTRDKGGWSIVFYRLALQSPWSEQQEAFYYRLGGWLQLGNDIFDVYKDMRDGIHTLVTDLGSVHRLHAYFEEEYQEVLRLCRSLFGSNQPWRRFLFLLDIVFRSRVTVCLEQLKELEVDGRFDPSIHSRNQLVCDMEKPGNLWKSFKWSYSKHRKRLS
jgi:hypothetical protein